MFKLLRIVSRHYRQLAIIASLGTATLLCVGMYVLRMAHSHSFAYLGLPWNLFLAWLPFLSALAAYNLYPKRSWLSWLMVLGSTLIWLLFLPNAPYLVTNLMHLQVARTDVPFWYDLILLVVFAWTGVLLGLVSLYLMQEIVRRVAGSLGSWVFALGILGISGFGVYLGRFLRWNSWDLLLHPQRVLMDVVEQVRHPLVHAQTFVFSLLMAAFFVTIYLTLMALIYFRQEVR